MRAGLVYAIYCGKCRSVAHGLGGGCWERAKGDEWGGGEERDG